MFEKSLQYCPHIVCKRFICQFKCKKHDSDKNNLVTLISASSAYKKRLNSFSEVKNDKINFL